MTDSLYEYERLYPLLVPMVTIMDESELRHVIGNVLTIAMADEDNATRRAVIRQVSMMGQEAIKRTGASI